MTNDDSGEKVALSDSQFVSVKLALLRDANRDIPFDVYLKLSQDNYAHVFSKKTGLDYQRLAQYAQKGIEDLYIRLEDVVAFEQFIATSQSQILNDKDTPRERKVAVLMNMTEQALAEVFSSAELSDETAEQVKKVIRSYVEMMIKDVSSLTLLVKMASHGDYLYYHSVATSVFSMFIAKSVGQFNQRMLELVALGGFLHDIGYTQLPDELCYPTKALSNADLKEIKKHPQLGLKMIAETQKLSDEVKSIVYQHHEEAGGSGYPNRLRGPRIFFPAKIVGMADALTGLIAPRPKRKGLTVEQAIDEMESRGGRYDKTILAAVREAFVKEKKQKAAA